ncbi:MAG TPA: hypothetical protein ENI42_01025 [Thermoplasmatales archaeon]|nr:hypothetical protein [Thermoplasmatales archaeon]
MVKTSIDTESIPLGVMLVSIFFITDGVFFLALYGHGRGGVADYTILFFILGLFFILIGSGIMLLNKWAFFFATVTSGFISSVVLLPAIYSVAHYLATNTIVLSILLILYMLLYPVVFLYLILVSERFFFYT